MLEALALFALVAGTAFWIDTLRAREAALVAGRSACERYGLMLLDDTVAVTSTRLARNEDGRLRVARLYGFEFSDTGNNRRRGSIALLGGRAEDITFEPYETKANELPLRNEKPAGELPLRAGHLTRVK